MTTTSRKGDPMKVCEMIRRAAPEGRVVTVMNVIGTPYWTVHVWEPAAGHSTISCGIPGTGATMGELVTRPIPEPGLPPGSPERAEYYAKASRDLRAEAADIVGGVFPGLAWPGGGLLHTNDLAAAGLLGLAEEAGA